MEGRLHGPPGKIGDKITSQERLGGSVTLLTVFRDIHLAVGAQRGVVRVTCVVVTVVEQQQQ